MVAVPADTLTNLETRLCQLESQQRTPTFSPTNELARDASIGHEADSPHECNTTRFIQSIWRASKSRSTYESIFTGESLNGRINTSLLSLPNRATADNLLHLYERHVYPLFPILHMPTIRSTYEQQQVPGRHQTSSESVVFYAIMNMIFAMGCLSGTAVTAAEKIQERANAFYERARQLLQLDAVDEPSLATVQYSLLTTQYLLYSRRHNRAHSAVGVAIRAAQTLRLDSVAETAVDQRTREMARRVWHGCVTTER